MNLLEELKTKRLALAQAEADLADPAVLQDPNKIKRAGQVYTELKEVVRVGDVYEKALADLDSARALLKENDAEVRSMAEGEVAELSARLPEIEEQFTLALIPPDPLDKKDTIIEIRAGTGGDEAGLFAAELFRAYSRYAERQGWRVEVLSQHQSDLGGFKSIEFVVRGESVYSRLKYEAGVHRVQRVPETEKAGRVHTSTVTVAVLPELEEDDFELDSKDLRIDVTTSSGAGGQSVNTTYSAIRMTHLPTGIVVTCQDERSQKQNKEKAMMVMRARVWEAEQEKANRERADERRGQIGTGDRSEKIRTYNFPQDRLTDHRINQNFSGLPGIMDGGLEPVIEALQKAEREM